MSKTHAQLFTSPRGAIWYHSKRLEVASMHVSVQQICCNHAVGMHTVGVKVNLITRKYTYLRKNRVQIRKSHQWRSQASLVPRPTFHRAGREKCGLETRL